MKAGPQRLPLPTLLSQALVAFSIELDNLFEQRMPHWTTASKSTADVRGTPWLVSLVMYANVLRLLEDGGLTAGELVQEARTSSLNLPGLVRWGYILVTPTPSGGRGKSPRGDWLVEPTANGRKAQGVWRPLFPLVEQRWKARFGKAALEGLREALLAVARQFTFPLPEAMPILGHGLFADVLRVKAEKTTAPSARGTASPLPLSALLAQVLLAFTLHFERGADVSLAIAANALRLLGEEGARTQDLPRLAGVSAEGMKMALGFLERRGDVALSLSGKQRRATLTQQGRLQKEAYRARLAVVEADWRMRFGEKHLDSLRAALEVLVAPTGEGTPLLLAGLEPPPGGWRAKVRRPETLPHHPLVLHRGGFPDGA
jgi:hypothetical protein